MTGEASKGGSAPPVEPAWVVSGDEPNADTASAPQTLTSEGVARSRASEVSTPSDQGSAPPAVDPPPLAAKTLASIDPPPESAEPLPLIAKAGSEEVAIAMTERQPDLAPPIEGNMSLESDAAILAVAKVTPAAGAAGFEYRDAPKLASILPARAPETGGTRATLTGAGFHPQAEVRLGAARPRVEFVSATRLELEIPAHPAGSYDIELTNPDGQSARLARAFFFDAPPSIHGVTPEHGPLGGGTLISVRGAGFRSNTKLYVGGVFVLADLLSDGELAGRTPAVVTPGPVPVRIVNPDGQFADLPDAFAYDAAAPPRVRAVEPGHGAIARPAPIALLGSGFDGGTRVLVAGRMLAARAVSAERIELELPALAEPAFVDVEVRSADGQSHELRNAFEFRGPPRLASLDPRQGSRAGDLIATLVGAGFELGCSVTFGGFLAKCEWQSSSHLRVTVPANLDADAVDVVVTNPDAQSAVLARAFTYAARVAPEIASLEPTSGPIGGNTPVLVVGAHLDRITQILVDDRPVPSFKTKGARELAFLTPPRDADGVVDVEFRSRDAAPIVRRKAFQYEVVPPPAIRSISPNRGAVGGGTAVSIHGEHFVARSRVLVDGGAVSAVKVCDSTTIEITMPPGEPGRMVDITVRSPTGQEAVAKRSFLYDPRQR